MTTDPQFPRRGHLYRAHLDKLRPVLVFSPDYRNERASDVIVVPLTTRLRKAPTHVRLRKGEGGIPEASVLKCEQITTLPREWLETRPLGGPLSARQLAEAERAVLHAIGVAVGY
jgi:mRNA-degrading endonuclease toxin of MazEF toxin-antitoxin module